MISHPFCEQEEKKKKNKRFYSTLHLNHLRNIWCKPIEWFQELIFIIFPPSFFAPRFCVATNGGLWMARD